MLSIMYGIYFNLPLDFAQLIFDDIVGQIKKKCAAQNSTTIKKKPQKKDPVNLILQRFFGLCFSDQLARDLAPAEPLAKYFPLREFKPTAHVLGYANPRPLSKAMLKSLDRETRKAYRRGNRRPEPVPVTPPRIGAQLGECVIFYRTEGDKEEPEVAGEHVLEGEENTPQRVARSEVPQPKKKKKSKKRKAIEAEEGSATAVQSPPKKKHKKHKSKKAEVSAKSPSPQRHLSPIQEEAASYYPKKKLKRLRKVIITEVPPTEDVPQQTHIDQTPEDLWEKGTTDQLQINLTDWVETERKLPTEHLLPPRSDSFTTALSHSW